MRVRFRPAIPQDFKDIEASIRYDEGFEVEMDFRPMIGDAVDLLFVLGDDKVKNPELYDCIEQMDISVVTSLCIVKDEKGIYLMANLDEEEDLFDFINPGSIDKSELN